jgi:hypothetical protein
MPGVTTAADAGSLTSFGVAQEAQHNFRRSVPSGSNIFSHVTRVLLWVNRESSSKTEITNLQLAIGVN